MAWSILLFVEIIELIVFISFSRALLDRNHVLVLYRLPVYKVPRAITSLCDVNASVEIHIVGNVVSISNEQP